MTSRPGNEHVSCPVLVIGDQFISPYPREIIVDTANLVITDHRNNIMMKVNNCNGAIHHQRMLVDAYDNPINVTIREKIRTLHNRWNVFRGASNDDSDLIFSVKKEHMMQSKTSFEVFLARNASSDDCYFMFKGSWSNRNCFMYKGHSSTTIAHMHPLEPWMRLRYDEDTFVVRISPNIDYAFVVAVIAIVDAMKKADIEDFVPGIEIGIGTRIGIAVRLYEFVDDVINS